MKLHCKEPWKIRGDFLRWIFEMKEMLFRAGRSSQGRDFSDRRAQEYSTTIFMADGMTGIPRAMVCRQHMPPDACYMLFCSLGTNRQVHEPEQECLGLKISNSYGGRKPWLNRNRSEHNSVFTSLLYVLVVSVQDHINNLWPQLVNSQSVLP